MPPKVQAQDPLRLSVFSNGSNTSSNESHQKKSGAEDLNRASFASASSSSQSHEHFLHNQPGEPPPGISESSLDPYNNTNMANRLSEPPSDPMRPLHRPPMRARGMTDVGPRRSPPVSNNSTPDIATSSASTSTPGTPPLVIVRQASLGRLHPRPAAPPPPIPIPPPPLPSLSPSPRSGETSDASTVRNPLRESGNTASSSSYHTAPEHSQDSHDRVALGDSPLMTAPSTPIAQDDSDESGSSLSFASSISETRDVLMTHGNVWSPRERDFSRHGKSKIKSIDKGKGKMKASEEKEERELEMALRSPSKTTIVQSATSDGSPAKTLKKALSQQNISNAMAAQRFSVSSTLSASSAHSNTGDDHSTGHEKSSREKGKGKPPKKQRSFHHPRIPLPPLPHLRQSHHSAGSPPVSQSSHYHADSTTSTITDNRRGSTPTMTFPSFSSLSISTNPSEKSLDKSSSSPGRPHTPVRKRLFSGSSLRRTPSSQAHTPSEEDTRSVLSLTLEDGRPGGMYAHQLSPNDSVASFWEDGEGNTIAVLPKPQTEYVPQQIMSPADMLALEAIVQQEQDERARHDQSQGEDRSRRDSARSLTPSVTVHDPDNQVGYVEDFGRAGALESSYMGVGSITGRRRGNSQGSSMSASTTSMSINTPSTGLGRDWHLGSPSVASMTGASEVDGPSSPPSSMRFWERGKGRNGQDFGPPSPQKQTMSGRTPPLSPLSPYSQSSRPTRSTSMFSKSGGPLRSGRPSTSQSDITPPSSPISSSFLVSPGGSGHTMMYSPPTSLPPPPRRRPRTSSAVTATSTHADSIIREREEPEEPIGPLPPPRRSAQRAGRSPYPPSSARNDKVGSQRRSIMRKPSFLDIEDEAESSSEAQATAKPFEDANFLDLGRGKDSFDTVRSVDILELVGPG